MVIRDAHQGDLDAIDEIYNHYVRTSTCTYQYDPTTADERRAWFAAHGGVHPVIVAERDGVVVGWGALSSFRGRVGYRFTVEDTVYVRHDLHGGGVGSALLGELLARAARLGHHSVIGGVSAEQAPSLALHRRFGFEEVARFRQVGFKFDQWLDVVFLQKML